MKRVLIVAVALVALVGCLSATAAAQSNSPMPIKACVALGSSPAVCATCLVAGITNGANDYGPCYCKYDSKLLARFKNMGDCVKFVQATLRPDPKPNE
jgi:opacity protein-like surface antigen